MKKVLLLNIIIGLFTNLLATNYVDEFPVYVYGDIRPLAAVFNSIAFISNNDIYSYSVYFAVLFSIAYSTFLIMKGQIGTPVKTGVFTIGVVSILLVPVDIHLVDKRIDAGILEPKYHSVTLGYEKISNVPYLVALGPSISTTISQDLIALVEEAFSGNTVSYAGMDDIGDIGYSSLGFGESYKYIDKIIKNFTFDEMGDATSMAFKANFKSYLKECVIPLTATNETIEKRLLSPSKDIYSELEPDSLGLTVANDILKKDGTRVTCKSFYDTEIAAVLPNLITKANETTGRLLNITDPTKLNGIEKIALANITSDIFTSTTGSLAAYALNGASVPLIENAITEYYRGTSMSGMEIANSITSAQSKVNLQTQGLGQFKWMVQILPFALHFFFIIIVASSVFALIFIIARGIEGGASIAKNYFLGYFQFEAIRVSLALVNNLVLYYAVVEATDRMAEFGGNPLAISRIPGYLDYIATMEGVMGMLGVSAVFLIPAMIIKGDISSATSALTGMQRTYAGNDLQTATSVASSTTARQKALGNMMNDTEAMAKLTSMGLKTPVGRTPVEYYQSVTNDLNKMSQGLGATLSQDKMNDYSSGTMKESVGSISKTAGFGSTASMSSVSNVNFQDGQTQGYSTNAIDSLRKGSDNWNSKDLGEGQAKQAFGKDMETIGYGRSANANSIETTSLQNGDMQGKRVNYLDEGRQKAGWDADKVAKGSAYSEVGKDMATAKMGEEIAKGFTDYMKGQGNKAAMDTRQTIGSGKVELSEKDLKALESLGKAGTDSQIGKAKGAKANYNKYGDDAYQDTSEYGEKSNIAKSMAKIKTQDGIDNAVGYDYADSVIKSAQQKFDIDAKKDKNILGRDGKELTAVGENAMQIKAVEDASALVAKHNLGLKAGDVLDTLWNRDKKDGKLTGDELKSRYAPFKDSKGNWKTGKEFWDVVASQKQGVFSGHNSIMLGDGAMASGGFSDGKFTGKISSGISTSHDEGSTRKYGQEDDGTIKGGVKDTLSKVFNEEIANDIIAAWNAGGEMVAGAAVGVMALKGLKKVKNRKIKNGVTGKDKFGRDKTFNPKKEGELEEFVENNKTYSSVNYQSAKAPYAANPPTTNPPTTPNTSKNVDNSMTSPLNDINNYNIDSGGAHTKHPKISNFATAVEAKTSGMMDAFKKVPFIGKVVGLATIGTTASQAYDEFTQGNYTKSALTMTSAIDVTGASDMALASIEARENLVAATRGRTIVGFGGGVGGELGGAWDRTVGAVSSLFGGGNSSSSISPVTANALQGGGQIGNQAFNAQTFTDVLKSSSVKQEFAQMANEQKTGMYAPLDDGGQMQMKNEIQDIGTRVRNSNSSPEKMMDQLNEQLKDSDMFKQFEKDLKKIKRKRN